VCLSVKISGIFCDYNVPKVQFWYSRREKKVQSETVLLTALTVLFEGIGIKNGRVTKKIRYNLLFSLIDMILIGLSLLSQVHAPGIFDDLPAISQVKPFDDFTHVVLDGALG
jgi:hypothetical protein